MFGHDLYANKEQAKEQQAINAGGEHVEYTDNTKQSRLARKEFDYDKRADVQQLRLTSYLEGRPALNKYRIKKMPAKSALLSDYEGKPLNLDERERARKIAYKKSRLYVKAANSAAITEASEKAVSENYKATARIAYDMETGISEETIRDLSYFCVNDTRENKNLIELYAGKTKMLEKGLEDKGVKQGQNVFKALDKITGILLSLDIRNISMETDKDIAQNAAFLEKLRLMVSAYDRLLAQNPQYEKNLKDPDTEKILLQDKAEEIKGTFKDVYNRIEILRSIAAYYVARKDLITDKYYCEHYNEELTIDVSEQSSEVEKSLADKITVVYFTGRHMMRLNGASESAINKRGSMKNLKNYLALQKVANKAELTGDSAKAVRNRQKLIENAYKKEDKTADLIFEQLPEQKKPLIERTRRVLVERNYRIEGVNPGYVEPEYSVQKANEAIDEFMGIDIKSFKFSSYAQMLENYDQNMALADRVDKVQYYLRKALTKGMEIPDDRLIPLRGKILAFLEIRNTLNNVNKLFFNSDPAILNGGYEKWDEFFEGEIRFGAVPAIPCSDMSAYLEKCQKHVLKDHADRANTIKKVYLLTGERNGENIPNALLEKKKAEYQKNAAIADCLAGESQKIEIAKGSALRILKKYCQDNPEKFKNGFKQPERMVSDYICGRDVDEMKSLYAQYCGSDEEQLGFWVRFYNDTMSVNVADYNIKPVDKLFDNFSRKNHISHVFDNVDFIGTRINELASKLGDKAAAVLGAQADKQKDKLSEITRNTQILKSFGTGYISGRFGALTGAALSKYRYTFSLRELFGAADYNKFKDLYNMEQHEYESMGLSFEEFSKVQHLFDKVNYMQMIMPTRLDNKRIGLNDDLTILYKEEAAAYDEPILREKFAGDAPGLVAEYNKAYEEYLKADKRAQQLKKDFDIDGNVPYGEQEKKEKTARIERAFEHLLSFDMGEFTFETFEKLLSKDSVRLRLITELGKDAQPLLDRYLQLMQDEESGCVLTKTDLVEVQARISFLSKMNRYYGGADNVAEVTGQDKTLTLSKDSQDVFEQEKALVSQERQVEYYKGRDGFRIALDKLQQKRLLSEFDLGKEFFETAKKNDYKLLISKISKEMSSVKENINTLKIVLTNTDFPTVKDKNAENAIAGMSLLVNTLYNNIITSVKQAKSEAHRKLRYGGGYNNNYLPMLEQMDALIKRCQSDNELFGEKAKEYYTHVSKDPELKDKPGKWAEVLKFTRAKYYDTDHQGVKLKKGGANLSDISIISSEETKKTIFFRKEDFAPKENIHEAIRDEVSKIYEEQAEGKDMAERIGRKFFSLRNSKDSLELYNSIMEIIGNGKKYLGKKLRSTGVTVNHALIGKEVCEKLKTQDKKIEEYLSKAKDEDLEKLGRLLVGLRDMSYKRSNCFGKTIGAMIQPERNLTNRHVATSRLAEAFGIGNMVSASRTAQINVGGKLIKGNLMEESGGKEIDALKNTSQYRYSNDAIKQCFILQIFDYLCGQVDRHFGNFHVITDEKTKTIIGIKAIDNDMAFGLLRPVDLKDGRNRLRPIDDHVLKGLPAGFVNKVMSVTKDSLEVMLGDILAPDEIQCLYERIDYFKGCIRDMALRDENITVHKNILKVKDKDGNEKEVVASESISYASIDQSDDLRAVVALRDLKRKVDNQNRSNKIPSPEELKKMNKALREHFLAKKLYMHTNTLFVEEIVGSENEIQQRVEQEIAKASPKNV